MILRNAGGKLIISENSRKRPNLRTLIEQSASPMKEVLILLARDSEPEKLDGLESALKDIVQTPSKQKRGREHYKFYPDDDYLNRLKDFMEKYKFDSHALTKPLKLSDSCISRLFSGERGLTASSENLLYNFLSKQGVPIEDVVDLRQRGNILKEKYTPYRHHNH